MDGSAARRQYQGSNKHTIACEQLLQRCKQEAKQLFEATAAARKLHWSHPTFISFCLSVEDVLTFGAKRQFVTTPTPRQPVTTSGRVLEELAKVFPVANSMYQMCYGENPTKPVPEYARIHGDITSEQKILWIRTSLIQKTLSAIVDQLLKNAELYYNKKSIIYHSVYSELFGFLIEGPCSLSFSLLKSIDSSVLTPGPTEIVSRHSRVIPSSTVQETPASSETWQHIQSLYQSSMNSCLYGKNNVKMQPPGLDEPLEGYLTLVEVDNTYHIKWLPNTLINGSGLTWVHVLSVNVTRDVAHIHCHQGDTQGHSELIMIGYNGIAYPTLNFPQPSTMLYFLEALENALHPRGCLEPPIWFLRQQHFNNSSRLGNLSYAFSRDIAVYGATPPGELPPVWSQVFRIRFTQVPAPAEAQQQNNELWMEESDLETKFLPRSRSVSPVDGRTTPTSPTRTASMSILPPLSKNNSRRYLLEKFQSNVSGQLLARYFFSWLSYCRHIARVKKSLSHLVLPAQVPFSPLSEYQEILFDQPTKLDSGLWQSFLSNRDNDSWQKVLVAVYNGGMEKSLRKQVWPFLLGLYAPTQNKQEQLRTSYASTYKKWRSIERLHYKNTDPTSTSIEIRRGFAPSPSNQHRTIEEPQDSARVPNLITLDNDDDDVIRDSSHDGHVTSNKEEDDINYDSGCEDLLVVSDRPRTSGSSCGEGGDTRAYRSPSEELTLQQSDGEELSKNEKSFLDELFKIDKDIPRCDRDYEFFKVPKNLSKLRNIICSYIWENLSMGYTQGMCDLLAPLLVVLEDEEFTYRCYCLLMKEMEHCFPPKPGVTEKIANLHSLLQVLEGDFFQYLTEKPMGDALFYTYRWFLVNFKREFCYDDIFLLWETGWAAKLLTTDHFVEFIALAVLQEYKAPIMDAELDPSEILSLFTDLAERKSFDVRKIISIAQNTISGLQSAI